MLLTHPVGLVGVLLLFGLLSQAFRAHHDQLRHQLQHTDLGTARPSASVSLTQGKGFGVVTADLCEDVEVRKLGRCLIGPKGVLLWGFADELAPRVFVEQLVAV